MANAANERSGSETAATTEQSSIQCAAWCGKGIGRCSNMGIRVNDEMVEPVEGRIVWISWCAAHGGNRGS